MNITQNTKLLNIIKLVHRMICNAKIKIMTAQDLSYPGVESFCPDLLLLFKLHEIWLVNSQENY